MITTEEIRQIAANYFAGKPVLRAFLFGSFARGEADEQSDIDVLVELDYANDGADFGNYLRMKEELSRQLQRKVDLLSANGLSNFIAPYIHKDKLLLYER